MVEWAGRGRGGGGRGGSNEAPDRRRAGQRPDHSDHRIRLEVLATIFDFHWSTWFIEILRTSPRLLTGKT